ncbi:ABC transporter permease [Canibacter zhoujuaniae]|uniref:ABC transporter permease n=1 Tax=Canibacter zhoujuaniae TaxID=2708343 RepID=UPI0014224756|nr:iron ABC transporter permease [Canibacter zhoujuaniae]
MQKQLQQLGTLIFWVLLATIPVALLGLFFFWPLGVLLARGLGDPLSAAAVFAEARTLKVLSNTLLQALGATMISVVIGVPAGFVTHCLRFPGVRLLRGLLMIPFIMPTVVVALAFGALYGPGGAFEWLGLDRSFILVLMAMAFFNITLISRSTGSLWEVLDPRLTQAARTLGASRWRAFRTVTLPQLLPAIASSAALVFFYCASSFGIVLILGGRKFANLESEIYTAATVFLDFETAIALTLLQCVIVAAALALSHRMRRRGEGLKLTVSQARQITVTDIPLLVATLAVLAVLQITPIIGLLVRSVKRDGRWTFENYRALATPMNNFGGSVLDAAVVSVRLAAIATVLTLVLAVPAAILASRRPATRFGKLSVSAFDFAVMLPVGISAVTLGFGMLLAMHNPWGTTLDLRSSGLVIAIAQTFGALPLVLRLLTPILRGVPKAQLEVAATLGASSVRRLFTVELPQLRHALGVAAGFTFAIALGEFGAASFLVRPGSTTLPVVIGQLASRPGDANYGTAIAAAVLLGVIASTVMLMAELSSRKAHSFA